MNMGEEIDALREEVASLRHENRRLKDSPSYRLGRLLVTSLRSPRRLLALPWALIQLVLRTRRERRLRGTPPAQIQEVVGRLEAWGAQVAEAAASHVVFMFSGTTHCQGTRGNRPIRQTMALLRQGTPVLFSYHRFRVDDPLPEYPPSLLVQSPVDITLERMAELARQDFGVARKVFVVSYPHPQVLDSLADFRAHGWVVLYDCRDDWEEFAKVGAARWYEHEAERRLVEFSDATLCVAEPLCRKMQALAAGSRVVLSPNAVESGFLPDGYRRSPSEEPKIVGYFGHLSPAWFDWDAFVAVASRRAHYRFEVIGHSPPDDLELPDNVTLPGPKPWSQLHVHAARWSAAIIPFRMGPLADGVDPIKIYEYLMLGLPVVSFRIPQIVGYPYTEVVSSVDEFCRALDRACSTRIDPAEVLEFISRNTWEVRARELLELADEVSS